MALTADANELAAAADSLREIQTASFTPVSRRRSQTLQGSGTRLLHCGGCRDQQGPVTAWWGLILLGILPSFERDAQFQSDSSDALVPWLQYAVEFFFAGF